MNVNFDESGNGVVWEHLGYVLRAVKNTDLGIWCGYIDVPESHPWYGLSSPPVDVHGGVTYAAYHPDGCKRIGFDCGHAYDYKPAFPRMRGTYRDILFVRGQCEGMAEQARAAEVPR